MSSYHINPATGEASICKAKSPATCKFGAEHYPTLQEAQNAQDEVNRELTNLMYGDENGNKPKLSLNSKHALVRAEMLRQGAKYNRSVRNDLRAVKVAAIQSGHDLDYYYKDEDLKFEVEKYLKGSLQTSNIKEITELAKKQSPMYDEHRNELVRRSTAEPAKVNWDSLSKEVNEPDQGGTIDIKGMTAPKKGFCFSPYPELSKAVSGDLSQDDLKAHLDDYQEKNKDILNKENHYLGFWRSPYDGNLYLDVSVISEDAKEARKLCNKYDQQAFFDLQTFQCVEVDKSAKSGQ